MTLCTVPSTFFEGFPTLPEQAGEDSRMPIHWRKIMRKLLKLSVLSALVALWCIPSAFAQDVSVIGRWKTIDDETNKPMSIVEIFEKEGKYFGRIEELLDESDKNPNPVCDKCKDDDPRKDQPIKGMVIIQDLVKEGNEYVDGTILDPTGGKTYKCKLWVEEGNLKVRGYIGFLYRTQTWLRDK